MIKTTVFDQLLSAKNKQARELSLSMLDRAQKVQDDHRANLFSDYDTRQLFYLQNIEYMLIDLVDMDTDRTDHVLYDTKDIDELLDYMLTEDYQNDYLADTVSDVHEDNWYFNFIDQLDEVN